MIEIIKPGRKPEDIRREATCRRCGCVFTFAPDDAEFFSYQTDGDSFRVVCPTCTHDVWVAA
jgi:hypothetical protein